MPIYEYECTKCGQQTEIWQKFSDPLITKCELCRGKMRKLISQSTFHLKGTGWYVTDYASNRGGSGERKGKSDKDSTTKEAKSSKETSKKETSSSGGKNAKD
jgi:putative FmdB family regulatory protein